MYVRRLHLQRVKRIRSLVLDFEHGGEPRMWTVLIGENGTAKTTILQSIALAAAGSQQVNTLGRPIVKHLRDRRSDEPMRIHAEFAFTPRSLEDASAHPLVGATSLGIRLQSAVWLREGSTSLEARASYVRAGLEVPTDDPLNAARSVHTHLWFVAGYGISRSLPDSGYDPVLDLPSIDRLQPLFDSRAQLASSSFANHFLKKDVERGLKPGTTSRLYSSMLNKAIKLGGKALLPDISKLELRGQGGAKSAGSLIESDRFYQRMGSTEQRIAGVALSHGYQSTFAWIADLIGHVLLEARVPVETTEMEGLVLIDEIDLYLHPAWQATFITALRRVFPKMQFVSTTHSPVVLAELAPHEIVRLIVDEATGDVVRGGWDPDTGALGPIVAENPVQPDPRPMTASEIYRTWFGLDRLTPNPLGEKLRRYQILVEDPVPSDKERHELAMLRAELITAGVEDMDPPAASRSSAGTDAAE